MVLQFFVRKASDEIQSSVKGGADLDDYDYGTDDDLDDEPDDELEDDGQDDDPRTNEIFHPQSAGTADDAASHRPGQA